MPKGIPDHSNSDNFKKSKSRKPAKISYVSEEDEAENDQDSKNKIKKRKRSKDPSWSKMLTRAKRKKNTPANNTNLMKMRSDNASSIDTTDDESEREDIKKIPLKTAIVIKSENITYPSGAPITPERIWRNTDFSQIPSNRPIAIKNPRILHSPNGTVTHGSPVSIITPGGTTLKVSNDIGSIRQFSNRHFKMRQPDFSPDASVITSPDPTFFKSDAYKHVKKILDGITYKKQQFHLTDQLLSQCKSEHEANNKHRSKSQNAVMVENGVNAKEGSADKYAKATKAYRLFETEWDGQMEWLHIIAHQFKGSHAQQSDNLVVGSSYTNTEMMAVEEQAKRLAKLYPEGIKISAWVEIAENTHIAKKIYYQISTPDFSLHFDFQGAAPNKPHITLSMYLKQIVTACLAATQEKKAQHNKENQPAVVKQTEASVATESLFKSPIKRAPKPTPKSPTQFKLK